MTESGTWTRRGDQLVLQLQPCPVHGPREPEGELLPLLLGAYSRTGGHHVHQSAAYTPPAAPGRRQPATRPANPNHGRAVAIRQNVPGFTGAQHDRASTVQRATNQGMHGADVDQTTGGVTVRSTGTGRLTPTGSSTFEDLKAYYALRAAGRSPSDAFNAVQQSASQLASSGAVPLRVPRF